VETCCICGRDLPNRYAVAGRCQTEACGKPFCDYDWRNGNRLCGAHGWKARERPRGRSDRDATERKGTMKDETPEDTRDAAHVRPTKPDPARARKAMRETVELVRKLGAGAMTLLRKLRKDRSPDAMLRTLDESLSANRQRREATSAAAEKLFGDIAAKKKAFEAAPPARKRILEHELRAMLAAYKASESELGVLLENERILSQVRGRMQEVLAYGMAGVSELQIDEVIDEVEEKVAEAEGRVSAARDLEKAGRRRERESDREDFAAELAGFDVPAASPEAGSGAEAATATPVRAPDGKQRPGADKERET